MSTATASNMSIADDLGSYEVILTSAWIVIRRFKSETKIFHSGKFRPELHISRYNFSISEYPFGTAERKIAVDPSWAVLEKYTADGILGIADFNSVKVLVIATESSFIAELNQAPIYSISKVAFLPLRYVPPLPATLTESSTISKHSKSLSSFGSFVLSSASSALKQISAAASGSNGSSGSEASVEFQRVLAASDLPTSEHSALLKSLQSVERLLQSGFFLFCFRWTLLQTLQGGACSLVSHVAVENRQNGQIERRLRFNDPCESCNVEFFWNIEWSSSILSAAPKNGWVVPIMQGWVHSSTINDIEVDARAYERAVSDANLTSDSGSDLGPLFVDMMDSETASPKMHNRDTGRPPAPVVRSELRGRRVKREGGSASQAANYKSANSLFKEPAPLLDLSSSSSSSSSASSDDEFSSGEEEEEKETRKTVPVGVEMVVIFRRGWRRGGTRYAHRGIDEFANVANFAESEQLWRVIWQFAPSPPPSTADLSAFKACVRSCGVNVVMQGMRPKLGGPWSSFVQIRGSLPLLWEQTGLALQVGLSRDLSDSWKYFVTHMASTVKSYGPVLFLSLLSRKGHETLLSRALFTLWTRLTIGKGQVSLPSSHKDGPRTFLGIPVDFPDFDVVSSAASNQVFGVPSSGSSPISSSPIPLPVNSSALFLDLEDSKTAISQFPSAAKNIQSGISGVTNSEKGAGGSLDLLGLDAEDSSFNGIGLDDLNDESKSVIINNSQLCNSNDFLSIPAHGQNNDTDQNNSSGSGNNAFTNDGWTDVLPPVSSPITVQEEATLSGVLKSSSPNPMFNSQQMTQFDGKGLEVVSTANREHQQNNTINSLQSTFNRHSINNSFPSANNNSSSSLINSTSTAQIKTIGSNQKLLNRQKYSGRGVIYEGGIGEDQWTTQEHFDHFLASIDSMRSSIHDNINSNNNSITPGYITSSNEDIRHLLSSTTDSKILMEALGDACEFASADFHGETRGIDGLDGALTRLVVCLQDVLRHMGVYEAPCALPGLRTAEDANGRVQCGIVRTNCLDCLDRTNAAQCYMGWFAMLEHLNTLFKVDSCFNLNNNKNQIASNTLQTKIPTASNYPPVCSLSYPPNEEAELPAASKNPMDISIFEPAPSKDRDASIMQHPRLLAEAGDLIPTEESESVNLNKSLPASPLNSHAQQPTQQNGTVPGGKWKDEGEVGNYSPVETTSLPTPVPSNDILLSLSAGNHESRTLAKNNMAISSPTPYPNTININSQASAKTRNEQDINYTQPSLSHTITTTMATAGSPLNPPNTSKDSAHQHHRRRRYSFVPDGTHCGVRERSRVILKSAITSSWAAGGDSISEAYSGSGSILSSALKQGKHTLHSNLQHAWRSLGRFYSNTFEDGARQQAILLLTGLADPAGLMNKGCDSGARFADPFARRILQLLSNPQNNSDLPNHLTVNKQSLAALSKNGQHFQSPHTSSGSSPSNILSLRPTPPASNLALRREGLKELKIAVISWNVGGVKPDRLVGKSLCDMLHWDPDPTQLVDIVIVCLQELVELNGVNVILNQRDHDRERIFEKMVREAIGASVSSHHAHEHATSKLSESSSTGPPLLELDVLGGCKVDAAQVGRLYTKVACQSMVGLHTLVLAGPHVATRIGDVQVGWVKTGLGGLSGNKGGLGVRFHLGGAMNPYIRILNVHLAAESGSSESARMRAEEFGQVWDGLFSPLSHLPILVGNGNSLTASHQHMQQLKGKQEFVLAVGDFNLRVNLPCGHLTKSEMVRRSQFVTEAYLQGHRDAQEAFARLSSRLDPFCSGEVSKIFPFSKVREAGKVDFPPTYKLNTISKLKNGADQNNFEAQQTQSSSTLSGNSIAANSMMISSSATNGRFDEKRDPSWCDRIFYRAHGLLDVEPIVYDSLVTGSQMGWTTSAKTIKIAKSDAKMTISGMDHAPVRALFKIYI